MRQEPFELLHWLDQRSSCRVSLLVFVHHFRRHLYVVSYVQFMLKVPRSLFKSKLTNMHFLRHRQTQKHELSTFALEVLNSTTHKSFNESLNSLETPISLIITLFKQLNHLPSLFLLLFITFSWVVFYLSPGCNYIQSPNIKILHSIIFKLFSSSD